jgi:predicted PhzF superfamily epimerase YddE/YHI9
LRAFTGVNGHTSGTPVRGNPCLIHLTGEAPASAPSPAAITQCVTWPEQPGRARVRCWSPSGQEIQLCGHGLLCSSHYWRSQWPHGAIISMGDTEVTTGYRDGLEWIALQTLEVTRSEIPVWAGRLLGQRPAHAAIAGPEEGYQVLEMPEGSNIDTLPSPGDALAACSRRALILTRQVTPGEARQGENIQYRYFAPQYGNAEDTATGSAMRVLAAYWQQRGAGDQLQALQLSADGGWLLSRIDRNRTWIGGRVIDDGEAA